VTGRAAALQGGLAALGLLAANFTWQREPERAPGDVTVIDVGKNDLGPVRYEDDKVVVDLQRRREGGDDGVWLHVVEKPPAKPEPPKEAKNDPAAGKISAPEPPPPEVPPPRDIRGNDAAGKALEQFAPLRSPRAFGVLDTNKLKELGLDGSTKKLSVTAKGDTRSYVIGQPFGAPGGEAFMRDTKDGRVYLMPRGLAADLQAIMGRMVDRRLHAFLPADFDRIAITANSKKKEFVQLGKDKGPAAQFAPPDKLDKPDAAAKSWHDTIWRVFPMEILGKGEVPKEGTPKVAVRVDYFDGKKNIGWMELGKVTVTGANPGSSASGELLARTEHSAGWLRLHASAQILTDAEKVVTGQ
jgi:hypothetical protein